MLTYFRWLITYLVSKVIRKHWSYFILCPHELEAQLSHWRKTDKWAKEEEVKEERGDRWRAKKQESGEQAVGGFYVCGYRQEGWLSANILAIERVSFDNHRRLVLDPQMQTISSSLSKACYLHVACAHPPVDSRLLESSLDSMYAMQTAVLLLCLGNKI